MSELPRITCDEDWLELRDGERATLTGRIERGPTSVLVTLSDWSQFVVESSVELPSGTGTITIERTEDGMREIAL